MKLLIREIIQLYVVEYFAFRLFEGNVRQRISNNKKNWIITKDTLAASQSRFPESEKVRVVQRKRCRSKIAFSRVYLSKESFVCASTFAVAPDSRNNIIIVQMYSRLTSASGSCTDMLPSMVTSPFLRVSSRLGLVLSFLLKLIDLKDHFFFWKRGSDIDFRSHRTCVNIHEMQSRMVTYVGIKLFIYVKYK